MQKVMLNKAEMRMLAREIVIELTETRKFRHLIIETIRNAQREARQRPIKKNVHPQVTVVSKNYPSDGLATVNQAADFLQMSTTTIYRLVGTGRLKSSSRELGDAVRIPWKQLHELAGTN